ncbi:hypothetical protein BDM02DRAFT_3112310 [Thelephora ganbajun]|uniref:Uncharacterized protein n=1 Tax=Thelephora ganbajun TaxID=370292 RepID=A0ACB6ZL40_THEGA|nr:hypothetical protein BDM02DRAFT_3112310 [Thelephora ganbajun]
MLLKVFCSLCEVSVAWFIGRGQLVPTPRLISPFAWRWLHFPNLSRPNMPRYWEILDIARVTINTLKEIGVEDCCFIGGMACKLYTCGKGRQPKDLDILCLTSYPGGAESIKRRLCEEDDRFFTVRARNPNNRWKVLYWRTDSDEPGFERFKIDILIPGVMDLPYVHPHYIIKIDKFPCAPLVLLLLHKLQGWDDRRGSRRPDFLAKIPGDVQDIGDLLRIANRLGLKVTKPKPYISHYFRSISYERVTEFSLKHPEYIRLWMGLGLTEEEF